MIIDGAGGEGGQRLKLHRPCVVKWGSSLYTLWSQCVPNLAHTILPFEGKGIQFVKFCGLTLEQDDKVARGRELGQLRTAPPP